MAKKIECSCFRTQSAIGRDAENVAQLPDELRERVAREARGGHRRRVTVAVVLCCLVVALAVGYAYGTWRFWDTFVPGSRVMGQDVGGMRRDEAAALVSQAASSYEDDVTAGDLSFAVMGQDIAYAVDGDAVVGEAWAERSAFAWPLELLDPPDVWPEGGISFDEQQLSRVVSRAAAQFDEANVSNGTASVSYDGASGTYVAQGEATGTAVDADAVLAAVEADVRQAARSTDVPADEAFRTARLENTEAWRGAQIANADLSANIALKVNGEVKTHINYEIPRWVSVGEDGTVSVDADAISTWCTYAIADYINTTDDTTTYDVDTEALAQLIRERLLAGDTSDIDVPVTPEVRPEVLSQQAYEERDSWDASRGRYIDVDLTTQYARLYDESGQTLWESAIVSGNPSAYVDGTYYDHSTPQGTYYVNAKMTDQTLVGLDENHDGESDYESYVSYWIPFSGNVVAFHDASWRVYFGGDIYLTDGSHGCVNLPYAKAEELYGIVQVGDEVYLHT